MELLHRQLLWLRLGRLLELRIVLLLPCDVWMRWGHQWRLLRLLMRLCLRLLLALAELGLSRAVEQRLQTWLLRLAHRLELRLDWWFPLRRHWLLNLLSLPWGERPLLCLQLFQRLCLLPWLGRVLELLTVLLRPSYVWMRWWHPLRLLWLLLRLCRRLLMRFRIPCHVVR